MKIAVEGCAHGELETIYDTIQLLEENENIKVDLLICCGDFQAARNEHDLHCMAIPPKYHNICSFYKYYNGEKVAPILTIFIGGNHEASNYLQELPYGGWVAPNIYYLGYAGVVDVAGVRIGGLSGIYKNHDFYKGHYEKAPYDENTKRSVYHIRNLEVFRLKQLTPKLNIFMSHDWPTNVSNYGNVEQLLRFKPFFRKDIETGQLGSKPCEELLNVLHPAFWFSAHLHCKFSALIQHDDKTVTKFLALDKCLPRRRFLQVVDVVHDPDRDIELRYDLEWLTILHLTNHLLTVKSSNNFLPGPGGKERYEFTPTETEKATIREKLSDRLVVPQNFAKTASGYDPDASYARQSRPLVNQQTTALCALLGIDDPLALLNAYTSANDSMAENADDSLQDNSLNYTSFNVSSSTPTKLMNLSLPKPKFEESEENIALEEKRETSVLSIPDAEDIEEVAAAESPAPKKFKRRNASIYASNLDDDL